MLVSRGVTFKSTLNHLCGALEKRIAEVWKRAKDQGMNYHQAAYVIAVDKIHQAIRMRGF